jgi:hypothetical protein
MMQSDIDSPCNRSLCSHCHVAVSISVRQLPFGKRSSGRGREHTRDQGAAFLGDLGVRHRLNGGKSSRPAPPACCPDPAKLHQLNRGNANLLGEDRSIRIL